MSDHAEPENVARALEIMRRWQWEQTNEFYDVCPISLELDYVINRLAMEGISRPQDAVLSLLCRGDLSANGDYRWRKYEHGTLFEIAETSAPIKPRQWQILERIIDSAHVGNKDDGFECNSIELSRLGISNCKIYDWGFCNNYFSTAYSGFGISENDLNDLEEWFSAEGITVCLECLEAGIVEPNASEDQRGGKPGRPPAKCWADFAEELAVYIHDCGLPEGNGGDGESKIIEDIASLLTEQGRGCPSRTTVQPVVKAVLRRLRAAGN